MAIRSSKTEGLADAGESYRAAGGTKNTTGDGGVRYEIRNANGIYKYDTKFGFPIKNSKGEEIGANVYSAELVIRNASDGKKYLYDIVSIKKTLPFLSG